MPGDYTSTFTVAAGLPALPAVPAPTAGGPGVAASPAPAAAGPTVVPGVVGPNGRVGPGGGRFAVAHQDTFAAIWNQISKMYRSVYDEARRASAEEAVAMARDLQLQGWLRERVAAVTALPLDVLPDDPDDPVQKAKAAWYGKLIRATPNFGRFKRGLVRGALWYGRQGVQVAPEVRPVDGRKAIVVGRHYPVIGDKINFSFDDGVPGILVRTTFRAEGPDYPDGARFRMGDRSGGRYLLLDTPWWRDQFVIHEGEPEDRDFQLEGDLAGAIHGAGLRGLLYFPWHLKQQLMRWMMNALDRLGAGGAYYAYCEEGNLQAEEATMAALAMLATDHIAVFKTTNGQPGQGINHIDPSAVNYDVIRSFIDYLDQMMQVFIVGQTLSSDTAPMGIGGGKVAEAHESTKESLQRGDAEDLGETLTHQLLGPYIRWNEPGGRLPFRLRVEFRINTEDGKEYGEKLVLAQSLNIPFDIADAQKQLGIKAPTTPPPAAGIATGPNPPRPGAGAGAGRTGPGSRPPAGNPPRALPAPAPAPGAAPALAYGGAHAPAGGVRIGGTDFAGGRFIPGAALDRATPAERKALCAAQRRSAAAKQIKDDPTPPRPPEPEPGPSVCIVAPLPPDLAARLAVDGGEPAADLHITLAYLGRDIPRRRFRLLERLVKHVAQGAAPLTGTIGGAGIFPAAPSSDGQDVAYLGVDVPGLAELRGALAAALRERGFALDATHGWTPHVTVAYLKDDADHPRPRQPAEPVRLSRLGLWIGGHRIRIPLGLRARRARDRVAADGSVDLSYAAAHAPAGGVTIGSTFYDGGRFIPMGEVDRADPATRDAIRGGPNKTGNHHLDGMITMARGGEYNFAPHHIAGYPLGGRQEMEEHVDNFLAAHHRTDGQFAEMPGLLRGLGINVPDGAGRGAVRRALVGALNHWSDAAAQLTEEEQDALPVATDDEWYPGRIENAWSRAEDGKLHPDDIGPIVDEALATPDGRHDLGQYDTELRIKPGMDPERIRWRAVLALSKLNKENGGRAAPEVRREARERRLSDRERADTFRRDEPEAIRRAAAGIPATKAEAREAWERREYEVGMKRRIARVDTDRPIDDPDHHDPEAAVLRHQIRSFRDARRSAGTR